MNGLDTAEWDPATDQWLPAAARFHGVGDAARGKAEAKRELQMRTGLAIDPKVGSCSLLRRVCFLPENCLCRMHWEPLCTIQPSAICLHHRRLC